MSPGGTGLEWSGTLADFEPDSSATQCFQEFRNGGQLVLPSSRETSSERSQICSMTFRVCSSDIAAMLAIVACRHRFGSESVLQVR